jgi:hypothetical protein
MRSFRLGAGVLALAVALPSCTRSSATLADGGSPKCLGAATPPLLDGALVPPGAPLRAIAHASATGTQNYVCGRPVGDRATALAWSLSGPEATLADCNGNAFAHHFAGEGGAPKWEASDGSFVVGKKVAAASAKEPGAVPWLLLEVTARGGSGALTGVTYVQRTATSGGIMPSGGCDEGHAGAVAKVPYSADYWFLGK